MRLQEWRAIIEDKIKSGLTIEAFCKNNSISVNTLKYWLHILREELNQQLQTFAELVVAETSSQIFATELANEITINIGKGSITVQDKEALKNVYCSISETENANGLKPAEYMNFARTDLLHQEAASGTYIESIMPWSESILDL